MSKVEIEVLKVFALIELLTGIWMISSSINNYNVIRVLRIYSPLWLLGVIFVIGGTVELVAAKNNLWRYILLVSTPITFLGLVYVQIVYTNPTYWGACIITLIVGIYAGIYAGKVFPNPKVKKSEI